MARREITARSSPIEVKTANEQLAQAQREYQTSLSKLSNPSLIQQEQLAQSIASKYDYVNYGVDLGTPETGINIGGSASFFVKGLSNQTSTTFPPEAKTTVSSDDAFPATKPNTSTNTINTNPKTNNPSSRKTDQSIVSDPASQNATTAPQVQQQTNTQTAGSKDAIQAGDAIAANNQNRVAQDNTVVNENPNNLPVTNNRPGRMSDEYASGDIGNVRKSSINDDAAKINSPMGTEMSGFGNGNLINSSPDPARDSGTGQVTTGTTSSVTVPSKQKGTGNKAGVEVKSNKLHAYANWTYKIGWYMLPIEPYNGIMRTGNVTDTGTLIARSGGVDGRLNSAMAGDIYFKNLRFTSIIGNKQSSAATNSFDFEMTIAEPYGASLIAELKAMAINMTNIDSISPAEVPYLLEIDFTGYKDDGTPVPSILKEGKKFIPVKIIDIVMKLEAAGSIYTITMVPYAYFAQTPRYAETEFATKLEGKQVIEMLGMQGTGLMAQLNSNEQKKLDEKIITQKDEYWIDLYSFSPNGSSDQAMSISPFAYPNDSGSQSTVAKVRPANNDPTMGVFNVGKGNIIKDVIKNVVLSSQYYNEKMTPDNPNDTSKPAELIKVIPVIEIMKDKFDPMRNEFAKRITFKVFNTLHFGEIFPYVGNAPVSDWGYSKIYNWLFTGKNEDVIDVDLTFQYIYFAKMQTNIRDHNVHQLGQPSVSSRTPATQTPSNLVLATRAGEVSNTGGNMAQRYINATMAAEWFDSKMMGNTGDNVTVDMRIIGDPDWIPQDGSIRGGAISVGENLYDRHGSIATDVGGVYVKLQLRTPRDYNPKTGLMDLRTDQNVVEGVYNVIEIENNFEDGRFTQTLRMNKAPNQEEEKPRSAGSIANPTLPGNPR